MSWKGRGEEQEAFERGVRVLVALLIISAAVVACTVHRMEQLSAKTPEQMKREKIQDAAMIQARWEASAKARTEVQP